MDTSTTVPIIRDWKKSDKTRRIVMVTAYDFSGAKIVDDAGADIILVGDSLGMVMLGYPDTLSVTIDDMVRHTSAVTRARPKAMVVADLPWMTYHLSQKDTIQNAAALIRAGASAVKLEGGVKRGEMIDALIDSEIPVMGHLGLTPQSVNITGGYKVQARETSAAQSLVSDAKFLDDHGCFAVVLEAIPLGLARQVTAELSVPTIGIGAGPQCDGQVLVYHDLLGLIPGNQPRFVRQYGNLYDQATKAIETFISDVHEGRFPGLDESYGSS